MSSVTTNESFKFCLRLKNDTNTTFLSNVCQHIGISMISSFDNESFDKEAYTAFSSNASKLSSTTVVGPAYQ